jgi:hypothetical protein
MRTTIRLDDDLMTQIKLVAARTNRTLTAVIEDALRQMLAAQDVLAQEEAVRLPTFTGHGLLPGVDLDDSAALLSLMERDDDAL